MTEYLLLFVPGNLQNDWISFDGTPTRKRTCVTKSNFGFCFRKIIKYFILTTKSRGRSRACIVNGFVWAVFVKPNSAHYKRR